MDIAADRMSEYLDGLDAYDRRHIVYEYGIDVYGSAGTAIEEYVFGSEEERDNYTAELITEQREWPAGAVGLREWRREVVMPVMPVVPRRIDGRFRRNHESRYARL